MRSTTRLRVLITLAPVITAMLAACHGTKRPVKPDESAPAEVGAPDYIAVTESQPPRDAGSCAALTSRSRRGEMAIETYVDIPLVALDTSVTVYERRTGRIVAQHVIEPSTQDCPDATQLSWRVAKVELRATDVAVAKWVNDRIGKPHAIVNLTDPMLASR